VGCVAGGNNSFGCQRAAKRLVLGFIFKGLEKYIIGIPKFLGLPNCKLTSWFYEFGYPCAKSKNYLTSHWLRKLIP